MARVRFLSPCLAFAGVSDYVSVGDAAVLSFVTNIFTIEFWMKALVGYTGALGVLGKRGSPWEYSIHKLSADVNLYFTAWNTTGAGVYSTSVTLPTDGLWHQYAWAADGSNARLYVDGVLQTTVAKTANTMSDTTAPFEIGRAGDSSGLRYMNGSVDEVRLWNVSRVQADIQNNIYRRLVGTEAGLVGYWKLDENTGTLAKDTTVNANTGTLNGPTWGTREVIAPLSVSFQVDWDGDGVYDDDTGDLVELNVERGRSHAFGSVVAGSLTVVLDNRAGKYSLDAITAISANLRPFRAFTLNLVAGQTSYPFISGKLFRLRINEDYPNNLPQVVVEGHDVFDQMNAEARVDTLQATTTLALAQAVLDKVGITSTKRVLSIAGDAVAFAFGERRSARAWMDAISLLGYRQFVDRQGRYVLLDRLTTVAWLGDRIDSVNTLRIETDDQGLTTRTRVLIHPFKAQTTNFIIWSSGEVPFNLVGGEIRTVLVSFRDPRTGISTGAITMVTPVASEVRTGTLTNGSAVVTGLTTTTDLRKGLTVTGTGVPAGTTIATIDTDTQFTLSAVATASGSQSLTLSPMDYAATNLDGSGDQTANLSVTLIGNPGTSAQLQIQNLLAFSGIRVSVAQVRGKLAVPQDVQALESTFSTDYPDLYRELDADLIQDSTVATTVLIYLLQRYGHAARRYYGSWTDADVWPSVVLEADINATVLLNLPTLPTARLTPAMTTLRGMTLHVQDPMVLDATLDFDFISLASGPGVSTLDHCWDHTL